MYADPRPFWVAPAVQVFSCSYQYGNPSGHSIMSTGRLMQMWLDYATTCKEGSMASREIKAFFLVAAFCTAFSIMYSRMWLGVHSLDQVLFGC